MDTLFINVYIYVYKPLLFRLFIKHGAAVINTTPFTDIYGMCDLMSGRNNNKPSAKSLCINHSQVGVVSLSFPHHNHTHS